MRRLMVLAGALSFALSVFAQPTALPSMTRDEISQQQLQLFQPFFVLSLLALNFSYHFHRLGKMVFLLVHQTEQVAFQLIFLAYLRLFQQVFLLAHLPIHNHFGVQLT